MSSGLRRLTRQTLQLFVTTMAWAAGLALVISSIVLVAAATGPRHTQSLGAQRDADPSVRHPVSFSSGKLTHGHYQVMVAFTGHGSLTTRHFTLRASQTWQLQWAYRCDARAGGAQFKLQRADLAPGGAIIRTTTENFAARGGGSAWLKATGDRHYLRVVSACAWRVTVLEAA